MEFEKLGPSHFKLKDERVEIFAKESLLSQMEGDRTFKQAKNVSHLPGLKDNVKIMPDAHEGYGFPIGGVAAFKDIITPGGVGFDINCGVRLLLSDLSFSDIEKELNALSMALFRAVPSGVGRGSEVKCDIDEVLEKGVDWCTEEGYARKEDKFHIEEEGRMETTSENVSSKAKKRGRTQLGTLGAGNHFLEVQKVNEVFKDIWGVKEGKIAVMIHCGSRGLGHQVCTDYVKKLQGENFENLPDKELAYSKIDSGIGAEYYSAMKASVNFAFSNRQVITKKVRDVFSDLFSADLQLVYDVCHNIAKKENSLVVHRKGATRCFGPGKELSPGFRKTGHPVLIPGSMGTSSFVLQPKNEARELTFGSCCHGSGRVMSRGAARRKFGNKNLKKSLFEKGIIVRSQSKSGLLEEAPGAYKDVALVVDSVVENSLAEKVAEMRPLAVIKG